MVKHYTNFNIKKTHKGSIILKMDTQTGETYRWDKKGLRRFEGRWVKFIENRWESPLALIN